MKTTYIGIDVSAKKLNVGSTHERVKDGVFDNTVSGHRALLRWLRKKKPVRVVLEPTGNYSLDLALLLSKAEVEVSVPNPRAVRHFGHAVLMRNKNDVIDAKLLALYGETTPWTPWCPPSAAALELRALSRAVIALAKDRAAMKCRLHAAEATSTTHVAVLDEYREAIQEISERQERLRNAAELALRADHKLLERFELLLGLPGIGRGHAITLLGELGVLAADMTPKQWTASAGLDPSERTSGKSVRKRSAISRRGNARIRQSLYLASLVAVRVDERVRRVHNRLTDRGKTKKQAHIAIARKYLHVIHALWSRRQPWDSSRFGA